MAHSVFGPVENKNRLFMPHDKVRQYLAHPANFDTSTTRLEAILKEVFPFDPIPVNTDLVLSHYLLVFCILLCFNHGNYLPILANSPFPFSKAISDNELPIGKRDLKAASSYTNLRDDFFEAFWKYQWQFCVPRFERSLLICMSYDGDLIVPIVRMEELGVNPSTSTFSIWVHKSYNGLIESATADVSIFLQLVWL